MDDLLDVVPQLLVSGVAAGALYALVAIGLVLIYKATDIVNFAQGEAVTVGAYMGWLAVAQLHLPYLLALPLVAAGSALVGVAVERVAFRPLLRSPPRAIRRRPRQSPGRRALPSEIRAC